MNKKQKYPPQISYAWEEFKLNMFFIGIVGIITILWWLILN